MVVEPVTPKGLAGLVARGAAELSHRAGPDGRGVAVGVDGVVTNDTAALADAVAAVLAGLGMPVLRASRESFLRPRSLRLELGDDPQAPYERWYDDAGLRRELLDPLAAGRRRVTTSLWDAGRDRATREPRRDVPPGCVAVVNGPFLLRSGLADAFAHVTHLQTSPAAATRRGAGALVASWGSYLDQTDPPAHASLVVRHDDPRHPAVVRPDG